MRPAVVLADDHMLFLEGIRAVLATQFNVVGAVSNGLLLLQEAVRLRPDVVLLDISMPVLNGLETAQQLRKILPSAELVIVTMHSELEYVREAFRLGASGYVLKSSPIQDLITAINEVLSGRRYVSQGIANLSLDLLTTPSNGVHELSSRQREVLKLIAEGKSRKEIAALLKICIKTVEFHRATLARKVGLRNVADITRYAIEHGLIASESTHRFRVPSIDGYAVSSVALAVPRSETPLH